MLLASLCFNIPLCQGLKQPGNSGNTISATSFLLDKCAQSSYNGTFFSQSHSICCISHFTHSLLSLDINLTCTLLYTSHFTFLHSLSHSATVSSSPPVQSRLPSQSAVNGTTSPKVQTNIWLTANKMYVFTSESERMICRTETDVITMVIQNVRTVHDETDMWSILILSWYSF